MMRVSANELRSLLQRAFEGFGFDVGAYENAAQTLVWAEMHGYAGLAVLDELLADATDWQFQPPVVLNENAGVFELDAVGSSVLLSGDLVCNLVFAQASESGLAAAKLSNCRHRQLIVSNLLNAARQGIHSLAYWQDAEQTDLLHIVNCRAQQPCPDYYQSSLSSTSTKSNVSPACLFIVCSPTAQDLAEYVSKECGFQLTRAAPLRSSSQAEYAYQQALDGGVTMSVSLWQALYALGNKVLVEATQQSRSGAGA